MNEAQDANPWRAPMPSEHRAKLSINLAGAVFIALGVLCCLAALGAQGSSEPRHTMSDSIAAAVLLGPGAALVALKSRVAAAILLALSALSTGLGVVLLLVVVSSGQLEHVGFLALVVVFWSALTVLTWLALRSTMALGEHGPAAAAERLGARTI